MIVIADAGPLRYLLLMDAVQLLPALFGEVFIPPGVAQELTQPGTPQAVRNWIKSPPPWLFRRIADRTIAAIALRTGPW